MPRTSPRPGPDADRLQIEGDWEDAVKKALGKERPAEGWPKPDRPKRDEPDPDEPDDAEK